MFEEQPRVELSLVLGGLVAALLFMSCKPVVAPTTPPTVPLAGSEDLIVIWRGFTQSWTHNHRWNRFGNWVAQDEDCPEGERCYELFHSAASGTSADAATFHTEYSAVEAPGVGFTVVSDEQTVGGPYGDQGLWSVVGTAYVSDQQLLENGLLGREHYSAILQGWDLHAVPGTRAAKPIDLGIEVGEPLQGEYGSGLWVPWRLYLLMDCSTEECPTDETERLYDYKVTVQIGVLGYESTQLAVTGPQTLSWRRAWNAPPNSLGHGDDPSAEELSPEPIPGSFEPSDPAAAHVLGLRRLTMHLYHTMDNIPFPDQHMLEWHSTVERTGGGGGVVPFQVDLFFKNWTEGMNRYQLFAYKDVGAAVLSTDVVLLEFRRDATFLEGTWDGGLWWAGGDASAATDLAVVRSGLVSP